MHWRTPSSLLNAATTAAKWSTWLVLLVVVGLGDRGAAEGQGAPSPEPAKALCALSGVVVDSLTSLPVDGALVELGPPTQVTGGYELTDAHGQFVFAALPEGNYVLRVTAPGYADGGFGVSSIGSSPSHIILTAGQWFSKATIKLTRLGALGGGVRDEGGYPVVGAFVRLFAHVDIAGRPHLVAGPITRTDDLGEYRFGNLLPGGYLVAVLSVSQAVPGGTALEGFSGIFGDGATVLVAGDYLAPPPQEHGSLYVYPVTFFPGSPSVASASEIQVSSGGDVGSINFGLQPTPAVRVSGRVEGTGLNDGFALRLIPAGLEDLGAGNEQATTTVAADGSFTFLGVPSGTYTVVGPNASFELLLKHATDQAQQPLLPPTPGVGRENVISGSQVGIGPTVSFRARSSEGLSDHAGYVRTGLTVGAADVPGLVLPIRPSSLVLGHMRYEDLAERLPSGSIEIAPANGDVLVGSRFAFVRAPETGAKTNADFRIPAVPAGDYVLRFVSSAGGAIKSIFVDGEDYTRRPLHVYAGRDPSIDIVLTGRRIRLSGIVRGLDRPDDGAGVIVFPTDAALWSDYGFTPTWIRTARTGSDGHYDIADLREGEYYIVAVRPEQEAMWSLPGFLAAHSGTAARVSLSWGDTRTVDVNISR